MEYIKTVVARARGRSDEVVGEIQLPLSLGELWAKAHNPNCFSEDCPNLAYYKTDLKTAVGNEIEEVHTFLGFGQRYVGTIKSFVPSKSWSMYTVASGFSAFFFSLPHFVEYKAEEGKKGGSTLSIRCVFQAKGLLGLPIVRAVVRNKMARAIEHLLSVPLIK